MQDTIVALKRGLTEILALKLLMEGEQYGYQIVRLIKERSDGNITLTEGALYTTLYRLESNGYVESRLVLTGKKRQRRYYKLTKAGQKYITKEIEKYVQLTKGVLSIVEADSKAAKKG